MTNAQYAAFDSTKPFHPWDGVPENQLPAHPRVNVTWYEAVSFCRWLGTLPAFAGTSPRLPVEEEWEYAWRGDDEKALAEVGWYDGNSDIRTHRVGEKGANPWGLYDVHGNVWEWTASPFDEERYRGRTAELPHSVDAAAVAADLAASPRGGRVVRGGSCRGAAQGCRSAGRGTGDPWDEIWSQGFRVLLSSVPSRHRR